MRTVSPHPYQVKLSQEARQSPQRRTSWHPSEAYWLPAFGEGLLRSLAFGAIIIGVGTVIGAIVPSGNVIVGQRVPVHGRGLKIVHLETYFRINIANHCFECGTELWADRFGAIPLVWTDPPRTALAHKRAADGALH